MLEAKRAQGRAPRKLTSERAWLTRCLEAATEGGDAELEARFSMAHLLAEPHHASLETTV